MPSAQVFYCPTNSLAQMQLPLELRQEVTPLKKHTNDWSNRCGKTEIARRLAQG